MILLVHESKYDEMNSGEGLPLLSSEINKTKQAWRSLIDLCSVVQNRFFFTVRRPLLRSTAVIAYHLSSHFKQRDFLTCYTYSCFLLHVSI